MSLNGIILNPSPPNYPETNPLDVIDSSMPTDRMLLNAALSNKNVKLVLGVDPDLATNISPTAAPRNLQVGATVEFKF